MTSTNTTPASGTRYAVCTACGSRQVTLDGTITRHQARQGTSWAACPGTGSAAQS